MGVRSRIYSVAATATLRRYRLRLELSRRYDQRDRGLARPAAGIVSFTVSTNRAGAVSRKAGKPNGSEFNAVECENGFSGIYLHRRRLRQGTCPADGCGLPFPAHPGNRTAA